MEQQQEILKFNPKKWVEHVPKGFTIMLVASRGAGKTRTTEDMVALMDPVRKWKEAYLFSETARAQTDAYQWIPESNRIDHLDLDKLKQLYKQQEDMRVKLENGEIKEPERILIIGDDIVSSPEARNGEFNKLFTYGRHLYIDVFALSQSLKGYHSTARKNCDLVVAFRLVKYDDRKQVTEDYLSIEDKKKSQQMQDCLELMNEITNVEYRCIVIQTKESLIAKKCSDFVRWYLSSPTLKPTMIGENKPTHYKNQSHESFVYNDKGQKEKYQFNARVREKKPKSKKISY